MYSRMVERRGGGLGGRSGMMAAWVGSGAARFCRYHGSVDCGVMGAAAGVASESNGADSDSRVGESEETCIDSDVVFSISSANCEGAASSSSSEIDLVASCSSSKAYSGSCTAGSSLSALVRTVELNERWKDVEGVVQEARSTEPCDVVLGNALVIGLAHAVHLRDDDTVRDSDMATVAEKDA